MLKIINSDSLVKIKQIEKNGITVTMFKDDDMFRVTTTSKYNETTKLFSEYFEADNYFESAEK